VPGGANYGTIVPGGSSGFVVDFRGRPGATGSSQAVPVSSLLGCLCGLYSPSAFAATENPSRLPNCRLREPYSFESRPSLCKAALGDVRATFFGLPCLPSHPKMGCGAAADVQRKKGARQNLCCVTGTAPTPPPSPPHTPETPCRTAGVAMYGTATFNLGPAPLGCQMSPSHQHSSDWMPQLSPDDNGRSRQMAPKRPRGKNINYFLRIPITGLATSRGTRRYG